MYYFPWYEHVNLFTHSTFGGHFESQFGTITNNSATNSLIHISWCTSTHMSVGYKSGNGISSSESILSLGDNAKWFSKVLSPVYARTNPVGMRVFTATNPHQYLVSSVILILANMVTFPLALMTTVAKCLSIYLLAIWIASFVQCLFKSLVHFSIGLFLLHIHSRDSLNLDMNLRWLYVLKISSRIMWPSHSLNDVFV